MRKILIAAGVVVATAGAVSTAHAEPNGTPMAFTCDGEDVIINVAGQGRVGYIDGEKFMAVSITGTVDGEAVFVKVFGGGKQLTALTPSPASHRRTRRASRSRSWPSRPDCHHLKQEGFR